MSQAVNGMRGTSHISGTLTDDGEILPAPGAGKRYRIFGLILSNLLATNVRLQSAATQISNYFYLPATGGAVVPDIGLSWWKTAANEALNLEMSAATSVSYTVIYDLVDA